MQNFKTLNKIKSLYDKKTKPLTPFILRDPARQKNSTKFLRIEKGETKLS